MAVLSGVQRKVLSDVVVRARDVVEAACAQRIASLGVAADKKPAALSEEEQAVRVGLRARARQLGSVEALVIEAGFEHWHRMLFTRFLADNGLLVDDQFGQPLSMDEVAEYAAESGASDQWEVASQFAAAMLPGIFVQDDPILRMRLPVETRQELEGLLDRLPPELITADDALGWVYQYWQSKRKDEVNRSERKIGGADLAPVTQLFTEDYMVRFLLENSLGAWWAARHPDSALLDGWEFLRRDEDGSPAVAGFEGWPDRVAEVTVMDPCCGSGHFLTAAFGVLWRMRVEEEGLTPAAAQDAVLRDNIFGLELDARCTQIATFALVLEAWKAGGYRQLPVPNVACSGIPARAPLQDWLDLAGGEPQVESALTRMHALFANADTLGSLIDPVRAAEQAGVESLDWSTVAPLVHKALTAESGKHGDDPAAAVFGQAAAGIARAADYLSRTYTLIVTNPPYLGRGLQSDLLAGHLAHSYPEGAADLATCFLSRMSAYAKRGCTVCAVTPQNWLFLAGYEDFRGVLLADSAWKALVRLGPGAFSAITGEVVKPVLVIVEVGVEAGRCLMLDPASRGKVDAAALLGSTASSTRQLAFSDSPRRIVTFEPLPDFPPLSALAEVYEGTKPGQTARVVRRFWEVPLPNAVGWSHLASSPNGKEPFSGKSYVIRDDEYLEKVIPESNRGGLRARGREGVIMAKIGALPASLYCGEVFDNNTFVCIPRNSADAAALWLFFRSGELTRIARNMNQKLDISQGTIEAVPFDVDRWRAAAAKELPQGLPEPFSDDPTQWLFAGTVRGSRYPLQVAVARLVGFRWPDQQPDELDALADVDGLVCLPAVGGESPACERLRGMLAAAYGHQWSPAVLESLLGREGAKAGAGGLDKWLRDGFFKDHCKVFGNRPFVWQIWDGRPDGFSVLVNYHRLDRRLLERLTYDYLGSWWIGRMAEEVRQMVPGGDSRLLAAQELKRKLELILEGEPPYDVYVRWKSLAEQPMGWEPDLNDGVRLNIRPFMTAGVLRGAPKIQWNKDRGKNPDGTDRLNDLHYTRAEKSAARSSDTEQERWEVAWPYS